MKEILLVLMVALVHQRNNINVSKVKTKFCLGLHYNADNNYLFVSGKEICKSKLSNKIINFNLNLVLDKYLINLAILMQKKCFRKKCSWFLIDYDTKANILSIHRYLMIINNT